MRDAVEEWAGWAGEFGFCATPGLACTPAATEIRELGIRFGLRTRDRPPTRLDSQRRCTAILRSRLEESPTVQDVLRIIRVLRHHRGFVPGLAAATAPRSHSSTYSG